MKKVEPEVKAFVTVCEERALEEAEERDKLIKENAFSKKPLLGIPVGIKDNFCTKGLRTTASSKVLENYVPPYSATVVEKLLGAGAVVVGKTNMDAWAHGSSTETSGFFTTRNPWDRTRVPGGSSGGSAAAVASAEVVAAIGSETAGSIRQPASWCGVVGFKPTYGRVSRYGVIAMASSLDCPGPLTKTVEDSALVFNVLAGKDEKDATTSPKPVQKIDLESPFSLEEVRIGIPREYFFKEIDGEVRKAVREAVEVLRKEGAEVREVSLLDPKYSVGVYTIVQRSEVSSNLARYDGIRFGRDRTYFGEEAKRRMMLGAYALSAGYYDKYYRKAQKVRTLILKDFERVFQEVDILVAPTCPTPALKMGAADKDPMFGEMQDILVEASSLAGLPGITVPCGFTEGLPIGVQFVGPQFSEPLLAGVASLYENLTEWDDKKPEL